MFGHTIRSQVNVDNDLLAAVNIHIPTLGPILRGGSELSLFPVGVRKDGEFGERVLENVDRNLKFTIVCLVGTFSIVAFAGPGIAHYDTPSGLVDTEQRVCMASNETIMCSMAAASHDIVIPVI